MISSILFVGDMDQRGRSYQRYKMFTRLVNSVYKINSVRAKNNYEAKANIIDRILWKIGLPIDNTGCNNKILDAVSRFSFDMIWIEKGNTIWPNTIKKLRQLNVPIISFSEDDMYSRHNRSLFYTYGLKYYDLAVTTKSYNVSELKELGARNTYFVNNTYFSDYHKVPTYHEDEFSKYNNDVVFVGTYENDRAEILEFLIDKGIDVKIWGNGWNRFKYKDHIMGSGIYGNEYIKTICGAKIALCFLRKKNRDRQTTRSVEIPACKGFMLAERTDEHLSLFDEGKEAEYFSTRDELVKKIEYYLNNHIRREEIRELGYIRATNNYNADVIFMRLLDNINDLYIRGFN